MIVIGLIATAIGIPVALIIPWFPTDASKQASNVRTVYDVLLIASVPIFVLVETVVLFAVWKFRMKPGDENKDGPPIHGHTRLEVVWTAFPALLLISLCTFAYTELRANEDKQKGEMTVNVTARQFAFEFSYPRPGGGTVVSPQLYVPKGQPVVFKLRSLDVIHSFFVPDFSEKLDAVPGITTTLRVTPTRIGTYPVECTELCGAGHSLMRTAAHVVSPSAFQTWLSSQKSNAAPPIGTPPTNAALAGEPGASSSAPTGGTSEGASGNKSGGATSTSGASTSSSASGSGATSPAAGKAIFTGSGGCGTCHTLSAAGTTGTVGPNLTQRLKSDCATPASMKIRGKTLADCIHKAITDPYAYIPNGFHPGVMPSNFAKTLGPTEVQALVNYLSSVTK
jgi:cytochrome c oxidase subunit 2